MKLVHAGASLVLLYLIEKLHDLTSSCSKLFEILHFCNFCIIIFSKNKNILKIWQEVPKLFDPPYL